MKLSDRLRRVADLHLKCSKDAEPAKQKVASLLREAAARLEAGDVARQTMTDVEEILGPIFRSASRAQGRRP